jgi:AcrR family transcriptional regulator
MTEKKQTKSDRTKAAILDAARQLFAERGYGGATIRDVAARAAIDPAMVIRYFGSKDELFALAATIELKLPELETTETSRLGQTLIRHFLQLWEGGDSGAGMAVVLRSALSNEYAAGKVRDVFIAQVRPAIAAAGAGDQHELARRAGLVSSQLLGLALCRYILKIPPVVAMSQEDIVATVGPTLQRYVTGT